MPEYRIAYTEVPNPRGDNETHSGVLLHIQPPVPLNPDAVERYLTFSDFEPIDRSGDWTKLDIRDVCVLGSTTEQTTIYASVKRQFASRLAERTADHTVELLRFMGATAIVVKPPTPDT